MTLELLLSIHNVSFLTVPYSSSQSLQRTLHTNQNIFSNFFGQIKTYNMILHKMLDEIILHSFQRGYYGIWLIPEVTESCTAMKINRESLVFFQLY